jgi:hypothetical protein
MPADVVRFTFDGRPVEARPGECLAAALLRAGHAAFRTTPDGRGKRGPVCGMGLCFDCRVAVTRPGTGHEMMLRACVTRAEDGMALRSVPFAENEPDA